MSTSSPSLIIFVTKMDTYGLPVFGSVNNRLEQLILALLFDPGPLWLMYLPFLFVHYSFCTKKLVLRYLHYLLAVAFACFFGVHLIPLFCRRGSLFLS